MKTQSLTTALTFLIGAFLWGCQEQASSDLTDQIVGPPVFSASPTVNFQMSPPAGAPFPKAKGNGQFHGFFSNQISFILKRLRCQRGAGEGGRKFYTLYVSTDPSTPRIRLFSFNPSCENGGHFYSWVGLPAAVPLSTEVVTIEIFLEKDDGLDGPDDGVLVLTGTGVPS